MFNHIFINQADSQKINLCIWQGLQQSHGSGLEKSGAIFRFCQGCLKVIFLIVSWAVANFFQPFMQALETLSRVYFGVVFLGCLCKQVLQIFTCYRFCQYFFVIFLRVSFGKHCLNFIVSFGCNLSCFL